MVLYDEVLTNLVRPYTITTLILHSDVEVLHAFDADKVYKLYKLRPEAHAQILWAHGQAINQ